MTYQEEQEQKYKDEAHIREMVEEIIKRRLGIHLIVDEVARKVIEDRNLK